MSAPALFLLALAGLGGAFAGVYLLSRRLDNYGVVDVAWSYAFAALALFYAATATGWPARRWLLAAMVTVWSVRLGTHLFVRVAGHHPVEDARYAALRRDWAADFAFRMFRFFQYQALSVVVLGVGFLLSARNPAPGFHPLEIAGAALWLFAVAGKQSPMPSWRPSSAIPPTAAGFVIAGSGGGAAIPIISSNGSSGSPSSCSPCRRPEAGPPSSDRS